MFLLYEVLTIPHVFLISILNKMIANLNTVISLWYREPIEVIDSLKKLKHEVVSAKIETCGWDFPAGEGHLNALKRSLVLGSAAKSGNER